MILLIITLVIVSLYFSYYKEKNIFNPVFLFSGFYGCLALLSYLQLYGMIETSTNAYFIIFLGILSFNIGVLLFRVFFYKVRLTRAYKTPKINHDRVKTRILFLAVLSMTTFSAYRLMGVVPLLMQGYSLDHVRMVYFGAEVNGIGITHLTQIIEMFINLPLLYAIMPIILIELLSGEKRTIGKVTIILSIIWIVLATLVSGGRATIYILAVEAIFIVFIYKKRRLINKKLAIRIFLFLITALAFMYFLSIKRRNTGEYDFLYALYVYFSASIPHMSYRLDTINVMDSMTYGMTFFSGVLRPIMIAIKWATGNFPDIYQRTLEIGSILQTPVNIGTGKTYNAFATTFFYFYYDLGYLGVFIDSLLYGLISGFFYYQMKRNKSRRNVALYLLIIQGILTSMIRFPFILVYYTYAFLVIYLLYSKIKIRI